MKADNCGFANHRGSYSGGMREKFLVLRNRIDDLTAQAGRDDSVDILLAVKTHTSTTIRQAIEAGGHLIGHNRAQELVATEPDLTDIEHETHFIGMLQSNKVNQVLRHATCVQSVHTTRLADRLNRAANNRDTTLEVFVQVNTSGEETKSGVSPHQALELAAYVGSLNNLRLRGLMTVGANSTDPGVVRASYEDLARLRQEILSSGETGTGDATELSMGMSQDLDIAIAAGATMVRVGSALFGQRQY